MEVKTEITKLWKDVQASAKEFASLGLAMGGKALERTGVTLKSVEESLKRTAEKLKKDVEPAEKTDTTKQ